VGKRGWYRRNIQKAEYAARMKAVEQVRKYVESLLSQGKYVSEEAVAALTEVCELCRREENACAEKIREIELSKYEFYNSLEWRRFWIKFCGEDFA